MRLRELHVTPEESVMRALILSDVHSNLEALKAVMDDAQRRRGYDVTWVLGDLVGYGPDPSACLALLRSYPLLAVAGNHDHAAIGRIDPSQFNSAAALAIRWTAAQLSENDVEFLDRLPLVAVSQPFTLVHGSLRAPVWEYLLSGEAAQATLALLETRYCLVGHSHIPFICKENQGTPQFVEFIEDGIIELDEQRWIINPGGVGRDRDPRPSYAIYDSEARTIERHRVTYSIRDTQQKMELAGLPHYLIDRLSHGV
jgi:diadenosine tetraphosphatase ApaH/serine/threonine PP2A family protein phosphatase